MRSFQVFDTPEVLAQAALEAFRAQAQAALVARGCFSVALSGGSTPRRLYELLAAENLDWERIHCYWGDERCVPPDHPDSCYGMAHDLWLQHVPIPPANLHRMPGEAQPARAAQAYERELRAGLGEAGRLDLALLGMGEDGHTASLFPGSPAVQEKIRWVVAVEHTTPPPPLVARLTLTLPVLCAARQALFLVAGGAKAERVRQVFTEPERAWPAQQVLPAVWFLDRAAARLLPAF